MGAKLRDVQFERNPIELIIRHNNSMFEHYRLYICMRVMRWMFAQRQRICQAQVVQNDNLEEQRT